MDGVVLGDGSLAGRGVYAARDFAAGEVVVAYRLRPLDEAEYLALPAGDDLFVHSFGGRRFLYPAPARFVNHSDDPCCYQDFDRCCDVALRPIATGEPITIDANDETGHELATFLDAYRSAVGSGSRPLLGSFMDGEAVVWLQGVAARGREAVVTALFGSESASLSSVEWLIGTGRWEALGSAEIGTADGPRHVTMLLKVVAGNWQVRYVHIG